MWILYFSLDKKKESRNKLKLQLIPDLEYD